MWLLFEACLLLGSCHYYKQEAIESSAFPDNLKQNDQDFYVSENYAKAQGISAMK